MRTYATDVFRSVMSTIKCDRDSAAILTVAQALFDLSHALQNLGMADSSSSMGAIENLSCEIKEGFKLLSESVSKNT